MKRDDQTSMGGAGQAFPRTHWSAILRDPRAARDEILPQYWKPVYCYLRSKGYGNEDAKDLTQGFFTDVVLGRELVEQADPARGRFRTFLLTTLNRYVTSERRRKMARKRMPDGGLVYLGDMDPEELPEPTPDATPEQAFIHAWTSRLLDDVLAEVERFYVRQGKATHWAVFYARVVQPIFDSAAPPSLPEVCAKHGIGDERRASNMIVTVKRRFEKRLRDRVRQWVPSEDEIEEEIDDWMSLLSEVRAGR